MAILKSDLPTDMIKMFERMGTDVDKMLAEMTDAGAEVALQKMKAKAPGAIKQRVKKTKTYKTPSDGGINTKVAVYGYIPFMPPRTTFSRNNGKNYRAYSTTKGIPADFLAILYEYGRSTSPFPKRPFMRTSFKGGDIEKAMYKVQEEYFNKWGWDYFKM